MNKKGFTLIELLAVIVILGIIMVLAVPEVMGYITRSKRDTLGNAADFFKDEVTLETSMSGNDSLNGDYTVNDGIIIEENPFTFNKKLSFDGTFTIDGEGLSYNFHNRDGICVSKKMNSNKKEFGTYINSNCIYDNNSVDDSLFIFDSTTGTLLGYRSYEYDVDVNGCIDHIQNDQFFNIFMFEDLDKLGKFCNGEKVLLGDEEFSFYEDLDFYIFWFDVRSFPGTEGKFYTKLYDNSKDLIIPDKINDQEVLSIADRSFYDLGLTSVKLPEGIISIGGHAFANNMLKSIEIPDTVTGIGISTFNNNLFPDDIAFITAWNDPSVLISYAGEKRSDVVIPNSFTSIGDYAFDSVNLESVTIPNTVTNLGRSSFENNNLTSVTIPDSITNIGIRAFSHNKLTNIVIPDSVVSLGRTAFFVNNLTSVTIPNSITTIGDSVFSTNNLTSIVIPSNIKSIGDEAFEVNNLTSVTIPDTVTSIGKSAFYSNELTSIVIPSSISVIEDLAFSYNKLTSVTMPNTITTIGWGAFTFNNLTNVTVPSSVTSIGSDAFFKSAYSNNTLSSVIYSGTTPHDWTNIINGYNYGTPFTTGVLTSNHGSNVTISAN